MGEQSHGDEVLDYSTETIDHTKQLVFGTGRAGEAYSAFENAGWTMSVWVFYPTT